MKKLKFLIVIAIFISVFWGCGKKNETVSVGNNTDTAKVIKDTGSVKNDENPCLKFDSLNKKILKRQVKKEEALPELKKLLSDITQYYERAGGKKYTVSDWVFPLEGYTASAIGGKNGNGYIPNGYNYFDGDKHTGHPAQDIFIHDTNQDSKDDNTGNFVTVRAITGGIVISCENNWDPKSEGRGGNFVWCYSPYDNTSFYYAHNSEIFVKPGDIVKPGDKIAYVGRTGLNAAPKRSPTHLHLSLFNFKNGYPEPENFYPEILKAKTK